MRNKLKTLIYAEDRAGTFLWNIISPVLLYAAEKLTEIADNVVAIDQAMKWGFGWELGPFEIWDALGLEQSPAKMEANKQSIPEWVKEMPADGFTAFYHEQDGSGWYYHKGIPTNSRKS